MIRQRPYDIFISHRNSDLSNSEAGRLYDYLKNLYNVCSDLNVEGLPDGDLPDCLYEGIDECTDFIVIIENSTFDRTIDLANKKEDWVRLEIAYALRSKKNVIPILLPGAEFPPDLPPDIIQITRKRGPEYSGKSHYGNFVAQLLTFIKSKRRYRIEQYTIVERERKVEEKGNEILRTYPPGDLLRLFFKSLLRRVKSQLQ